MTKKRRSGGRNKPAGARGHVSLLQSRHICVQHLQQHGPAPHALGCLGMRTGELAQAVDGSRAAVGPLRLHFKLSNFRRCLCR